MISLKNLDFKKKENETKRFARYFRHRHKMNSHINHLVKFEQFFANYVKNGSILSHFKRI